MAIIRILHVIVQPVLVIEDDNGEFEAGPPVGPQSLKISQLAGLGDELTTQLATLQASLDAQGELT